MITNINLFIALSNPFDRNHELAIGDVITLIEEGKLSVHDVSSGNSRLRLTLNTGEELLRDTLWGDMNELCSGFKHLLEAYQTQKHAILRNYEIDSDGLFLIFDAMANAKASVSFCRIDGLNPDYFDLNAKTISINTDTETNALYQFFVNQNPGKYPLQEQVWEIDENVLINQINILILSITALNKLINQNISI